jgi:hypothetical protein
MPARKQNVDHWIVGQRYYRYISVCARVLHLLCCSCDRVSGSMLSHCHMQLRKIFTICKLLGKNSRACQLLKFTYLQKFNALKSMPGGSWAWLLKNAAQQIWFAMLGTTQLAPKCRRGGALGLQSPAGCQPYDGVQGCTWQFSTTVTCFSKSCMLQWDTLHTH